MSIKIKRSGKMLASLAAATTLMLAFQNFTYPNKPVIGAFVDGESAIITSANNTKEANMRNLENYLGVPAGSMVALEYGNNDSFEGLKSGIHWATDGWHSLNPNRKMQWSIPLTVNNVSLKDVADGKYDAYFLDAAQTVAKDYPQTTIRLGWEFNGSWMPWAAAGHEQDFINAFRRVALIFRGVSPQFKFDWCPNIGVQSTDPVLSYPGDDVVDFIGMDYYEDNWNNSSDRWNYYMSVDRGLQWHAQFAAAHNKPMSYAEFGSGKGGDDPYFINQMFTWMSNNNVAYATYWDSNSAYPGQIHTNSYPNIGAAFRQTFATLLAAPVVVVVTPPATPVTPAPRLTVCADENGYCSFSGTQIVRYGTAKNSVDKTLTGGTACNNSVFGDPDLGYGKSCWLGLTPVTPVTPVTPAVTYTLCGYEGQNCAFSGTKIIRYGTDAHFVEKTLTGGTACDNSVFGDPDVGFGKTCKISSATVAVAPVTTPAPSASLIVSVQNVGNSKCFDINNGQTNNGLQIEQDTCTAADKNQQFIVTKNNDASYSFRSVSSGKCMDLAGGQSGNGVQILQWDCDLSKSNQRFNVKSATGGPITSRATNQCVDVPGNSGSNGMLIQQYSCNGSGAQNFRMVVRQGTWK